MNCCDDYGNCNQGRDCPLRKESTAVGLRYCRTLGPDDSPLPERNLMHDVIEGFLLLIALACLVIVVSCAAGYFLHWRLL